MSAFYNELIAKIKKISKSLGYNWWEEYAYLSGSWLTFVLVIFSLFNFMELVNTQEDISSNKSMTTFLILIVLAIGSYLFSHFKQKSISKKEIKLSLIIISECELDIQIIKKLKDETMKYISDARRVAQWATGGLLTLVVLFGSGIISISSAFISKLPSSKFENVNSLNYGTFIQILQAIGTYLLLIFSVLSLVYALFQSHTFKKRRYLRLFKDIEYQLLLKKSVQISVTNNDEIEGN